MNTYRMIPSYGVLLTMFLSCTISETSSLVDLLQVIRSNQWPWPWQQFGYNNRERSFSHDSLMCRNCCIFVTLVLGRPHLT